jgi:hypothetical protein
LSNLLQTGQYLARYANLVAKAATHRSDQTLLLTHKRIRHPQHPASEVPLISPQSILSLLVEAQVPSQTHPQQLDVQIAQA